ncbi:MAG: hypothetical protein SFU56_00750 [Capsulimonadales bacterium]|nr:hypothetical protein [Capsulimonadales bacterium]
MVHHCHHRYRRLPGFPVFCLLLALLATSTPHADACPVCDSPTGREVRREIFNEEFGPNLLRTVLPFPIFLGITAFLYVGPPSFRRRNESTPAEDTL